MRTDEINVLLVEDDPDDAFLARKFLEEARGYTFHVLWEKSLAAGAAHLSAETDAVVLDLSLPDAQGWETYKQFQAAAPHVPIVLLTGNEDEELGMRAIHEGAQDYLLKSDISAASLQRSLRHAIERKKTEEALARTAEELRGRNEQIAEELALARDMQQALLPQRYPCFPAGSSPEKSALGFAHVYRPSRVLGGDFFAVHAISGSAACVFVCDVMGHGVRSALVTATMRGLLEELKSLTDAPGAMLAELNRGLREVTRRPGQLMFASAVCLYIDVVDGFTRYAVAGHPAPLHLPVEGGGEWLGIGAGPVEPALGLFEDQDYTAREQDLQNGERLLVITDGLYEVEGSSGVPYGKQQVLRSADAHAALPLQDLVSMLVQDADAFAGGNGFEDDVCVVSTLR